MNWWIVWFKKRTETAAGFLFASSTRANSSKVQTVKYLININYRILINILNCTFFLVVLFYLFRFPVSVSRF
jgi:hypothetical protein